MGARTDGPWEINKYGGHIEIQQSDPDGVCLAVMSAGTEADALGMAAAPDLYAACWRWVNADGGNGLHLTGCGYEDGWACTCGLEDARAALKLADEGRP